MLFSGRTTESFSEYYKTHSIALVMGVLSCGALLFTLCLVFFHGFLTYHLITQHELRMMLTNRITYDVDGLSAGTWLGNIIIVRDLER